MARLKRASRLTLPVISPIEKVQAVTIAVAIQKVEVAAQVDLFRCGQRHRLQQKEIHFQLPLLIHQM